MSDTIKLAIQFTAIDMLSGIVSRLRNSIPSLGEAGRKVKSDFDQMEQSITKGLKAIAVGYYTLKKIKPGVDNAADLQEALIDVRMNLLEAGKSANDLNAELAQVKSTAIDVSKTSPFSAKDIVQVENTLLKAGLKMKDVIGKGGAAWAATALATITKEAPAGISEALVSIASPFNIKGQGYGELADFLQKVDTASVTSVPELMEGMKYVAGTAANMRVSWKDTLAAMGAMSQQGLRGTVAGTSLNQFLLRLNAITPMSRKAMQHLGLNFHDAAGRLKPLNEIIDQLRDKTGKLTDKQKMMFLEKIFDTEGARSALALMHEGEGSWEAVNESIGKAVSLQDKMNERLKGFNASVQALAGTSKTTLANIFDPLLSPLTRVIDFLNEIVFKIGEIASKNRTLASLVSGGMAVTGAAVAGYGLVNILKGGAAGMRVLKGVGGVKGLLKSLGGTASGIAQGKAVEAATGVTPVFVTNWPLKFMAGESSPIDALKSGPLSSGGIVDTTAKSKGLLNSLAGKAGLVGLAATGGYAVGSGINWALDRVIEKITGEDKGLGGAIYDWLHNDAIKNNINISIDKDGRVRQEGNMKADVKLDRGSFAPAY